MEPALIVLWSGVALAVLGAVLTWSYHFLVSVFFEEVSEAVGRWLMRIGAVVAVVGALAHLATITW